jgi:thiol-disulfide isomerase/thioredoxin
MPRPGIITLIAMLLAAAVPAIAQEAPAELVLRDVEGREQSLAAHRGKIVILNFWATWCVPCREEMPLLEKLHRELAPRGVIVIGPSADEESTQKQIPRFLRQVKVTFPIWLGATVGEMERLGLGVALPATAILDRDGRIVFRILGPLTEPALRERLDWLLGDRTAEIPAPHLDTFEEHAHDHAGEEHAHDDDHVHGGVGMEGASTVPS